MSGRVHIVEVGPRDGLQNEKTPIGVADRIAFVEALIGAGLHTVEVGAFIHLVTPSTTASCWRASSTTFVPGSIAVPAGARGSSL